MLTHRNRQKLTDTTCFGHSIGSRLALYWLCMALATLSAALFLLSVTGVLSRTARQFGETTTLQQKNTAALFSAQMDALTARGIELSENVSEELESFLARRNLPFDALNDDPELIAELETAMIPAMKTAMEGSTCSGVYFCLDATANTSLPDAENSDLFKHFVLRFSISVGFIVLRSIFLRQSANERHIKEMGHAFIKLAYNDVMTETLNKKAMETYGTFIADKTAPERVSVIIFDVDDFKSYNDNYSHMKGDEALRRVAGSVVGVLAAADRYLFRFGGEEFVAILPDIGEEEARRIAGALLDAVRATAVPREDLPDRHIVTASFGVACGTGRELKDFSLIAKADRQLYICKNNGKNCVAASGAIYR